MIGRTLSHYRIVGKLGEGGMGVVYKAVDTRLERTVALKILPPDRTADPDRKRRFVQEAKAASALNHPNIVTIYDIGSESECDFIAMEYVAGKTLDELTFRRSMHLKDVLRLSVQIASGLACAHGAGIVHRDLKPGNVMVDEHGRAKILDFGLAKLVEAPATEFATTLTLKPRTKDGTIVGTTAYMSPEQAEGKEVDARSDIFSFGSMLYEMLSGHRAFHGNTQLSTLAAILNQEPPALSAETPHDLEKIVTRCLRKDRERRFQHMDDVKIALEELKEESESGTLRSTESQNLRWGRRLLVWILGGGLIVGAGGVGTWWLLNRRDVADPLTLTRFTSDAGLTTDPAISPDGSLIAYASDRSGSNDLDIWVQHRRGGAPIRVTRGEGDEREPSFSPDGSQIAYSGNGIWIVSSLGGEPSRIAPDGRRPRFSPDGKQILFASGGRVISSNIWLVNVGGGPPRQLQREFAWADYPVWSPDGKSILFLGNGEGRPDGWWLTSPADEPARRVSDTPGQPEQWLPNGKILYAGLPSPNSLSNDLFVASIASKERPRRLTGTAGIVGPVSVAADGSAALFASGTVMVNLWSLPLDTNSGKVSGDMEPVTQGLALNWYPSISADGRRLVYSSTLEGNPQIWLMDMTNGANKSLTTGPDTKIRPVINADGNRVAYTRIESLSKPAIWTMEIPADASAPRAPRKVCDSGCAVVWDWSLDGRGLFFLRYKSSLLNLDTRRNISVGLLRFPDGEISDYLADPQRATYQAHLSPDGRWVTVMYAGQVRLAPVRNGNPAGPNEWKIAVKGPADLPRWSPDGNMLFFLSARDSFRCFWAQELQAQTKEPIGEPFAVQHLHRARRSLRYIPDSGAIGPALARDRMVFPLVEGVGNIWVTRLKLD